MLPLSDEHVAVLRANRERWRKLFTVENIIAAAKTVAFFMPPERRLEMGSLLRDLSEDLIQRATAEIEAAGGTVSPPSAPGG